MEWGGGTTVVQCQLNAMATTNPNYFCPTRRRPQTYTYSDSMPLGATSNTWGPLASPVAGPANPHTHAPIDYAGSCFNVTLSTGYVAYPGGTGYLHLA